MAAAEDTAAYHHLLVPRKTMVVYRDKDFPDYVLMIVLTAAVVVLSYGALHPMTLLGLLLCAGMLIAFPLRHGWQLGVPLLLRRPHEPVLLAMHKLANLRLPYFMSLGVLLLQAVLIALTPGLPHHAEWMRIAAQWLFFIHFAAISAYRTVILVAHLRKRALIREVLLQTVWKKQLERQPDIVLEIVHAYLTGMLAHVVLIAPWYLVIMHVDMSLVFAPVVLGLNVWIHLRYLKVVNAWFYRDHWLGHNSEFDFLYLHGPHHDAIPSGLIGVAGNGFLEGFLRHVAGAPTTFYCPLAAAVFHTLEVKTDIEVHQYIPGVYPRLSSDFIRLAQHSTHHFGRVAPYGFATHFDRQGGADRLREAYRSFPPEFRNSIELDERLNDFEWDNATHRQIVKLFERYQRDESVEGGAGR